MLIYGINQTAECDIVKNITSRKSSHDRISNILLSNRIEREKKPNSCVAYFVIIDWARLDSDDDGDDNDNSFYQSLIIIEGLNLKQKYEIDYVEKK